MKLKANLRLNKLSRVGGWLEQLGIKLISTQVVVEVEVGVELGNIHHDNLIIAPCRIRLVTIFPT